MDILMWSFIIAMIPIVLKWFKVNKLAWIWTLVPATLVGLSWGTMLYFFLTAAK